MKPNGNDAFDPPADRDSSPLPSPRRKFVLLSGVTAAIGVVVTGLVVAFSGQTADPPATPSTPSSSNEIDVTDLGQCSVREVGGYDEPATRYGLQVEFQEAGHTYRTSVELDSLSQKAQMDISVGNGHLGEYPSPDGASGLALVPGQFWVKAKSGNPSTTILPGEMEWTTRTASDVSPKPAVIAPLIPSTEYVLGGDVNEDTPTALRTIGAYQCTFTTPSPPPGPDEKVIATSGPDLLGLV